MRKNHGIEGLLCHSRGATNRRSENHQDRLPPPRRANITPTSVKKTMPKPNLRISPKPREVLKDEQRRAEYDQLWQHRNDPGFGRQRQTHEQSYSQQDFDDIFSSMFGQQAHQRRRQHAARGHDLEIEVAVFLEETLAEQTRTISYNLPVYNVFGMIESETPKTLNVKIPAGVVDGQRIRLKGRGTPGENGGPNGDLWLVIHIAPHPLFDIVGHNWRSSCRWRHGRPRWARK